MWRFIKSSTNKSNWLKGTHKEVAFLGRSNVGKSTLINSVAKQKIARTSRTPGRTRLINFFQFKNERKFLVDLPGYGYAKMSKTEQRKMLFMIEQYLLEREELQKVFLLIDSKIGPLDIDLEIINFMITNDIDFILIGTKLDKCKQSELHKTNEKIAKISDDYLFVSSNKAKNIQKLCKIIMCCF